MTNGLNHDGTKRPARLLGIDTNYKTAKGRALGYMTGILYLTPADASGYEVCPMRSQGCTDACLNSAGRGAMNCVQRSRLAKTLWYFEHRESFLQQLDRDILALVRKAKREGFTPCVRLNGTSDIPWDRIRLDGRTMMERHSDVQFYDYTKIPKQALAFARGAMPSNYHVTFSLTESNDTQAVDVLAHGGNVAAVYRDPQGAHAMLGNQSWPSVNGDDSDLRFLDAPGSIVALYAKGKARHDVSGFVR